MNVHMCLVPILEYFTALLTNPTSQAIEIIGEQTHVSFSSIYFKGKC